MKVNIISDFDAILMINSESYVLDKKNERVEIVFEEKTSITCFVYPKKDKSLPYCVHIEKVDENLICQSDHVQFFQVAQNLYQMHLEKFKLNAFNVKKVFSKDLLGFSLTVIETQTSLFLVKEKDKINFFEIENSFEHLAFDVIEKVPYFVANKKNGKKYVCVFCPSTEKFFGFEAIKIKIEENEIEIMQDLSSHARHGKKIVLKLEDEQVVIEKEELLYLNQKPEILSNLKVVPFAFFESVRLKDFNLAKTYLSPKLKSSLSDDILKDYFGDFVKVVPNNYNFEKGYFVSLLTKDFCKVFSFDFENGKISDINFLKEYPLKSKKH